MDLQFNFAGVSDNDASLQGSTGVFGLNENAHLTKLEYNPNGGKDGAPAEACDITVEINGRDYNVRMFVPNGALKSGNKTVNPTDPDYSTVYNKTMTQLVASIKHAIKAVGVDDNTINQNSNAQSFQQWMENMIRILPQGWQQKPIDVFLEYQWNIREGQNQTYPTLPTNMKGGRFLCPHMQAEGEWHAVKEPDGSLCYKDDKGNIHVFTRNASFMNSNKGKIQRSANQQTQTFDFGATAAPAMPEQTYVPDPFQETSW